MVFASEGGAVLFLSILTTAPPQEQKLALQNRTRDTHLNKLGEVEKRFAALSRQCVMVKEAHGKLEHNGNKQLDKNKNCHPFLTEIFAFLSTGM